jgi:putative oxidoreductase
MIQKSKITTVFRSVLGFIFVAGPMAGAFHLAPQPVLPPAAAAFTGALAGTGYMLPLLLSTEVVSGILLLSGFMVPLALVMLAPVIVNIDAFHLFLNPGGSMPAIIVTVLELLLAWRYRRSFEPLFRTDHVQQETAPQEDRATQLGA